MPKKLKRYYGRGDLHFLTFSCYTRLPLLGTIHARNIFVHALGKMRERYAFRLVGYVVMPDHVHLLMSEPLKGTPSVVLKAFKQRVSRDLRAAERGTSELPTRKTDAWGTLKTDPPGTPKTDPWSSQTDMRVTQPSPAAKCDGLPRFWQPRFYDFNVYSAKKRREKLEYMHANPVKRGLVNHPGGWIWSSFLFYEGGEPGLVPIDPVN
jgi:REP-associated tyrosine transposase